MADQKITELTELETVDAGDWVAVVDVSDTTDGPDGTTKKAAKSEFKGDTGDTVATGDTGATGAAGADGADAFVYIAYASDDQGTGFTTTFDADLDYIAVKSTTTEIVTPQASDFTGLWKNYKGATGAQGPQGEQGEAGAGSGDMLAATYDPQNVAGDAFDTDNHTDGMTNKVFTATEKTKLAGIETAADVTDVGNIGSSIHGATEKATPVDADTLPLIDSAASNVLKKVTWANIKTTLLAAIAAASDTVSGLVELAIASEVTTGTDTARAITPDALAGSSIFGVKALSIQITAGNEAVTTGDGKAYVTIPAALNGMNLIRAQATVVTAGTTNATTIMVHNLTDASDMLSGAISIASAGKVGTVGTVNTSEDDVVTNDILRIDVDSVSTTPPQGLMVVLEFQLP